MGGNNEETNFEHAACNAYGAYISAKQCFCGRSGRRLHTMEAGRRKWNNAEAWPASEYPNAKYHYMHEAGCYVTTIAMLLRHYDVVTDTNVNDFNPWICNIALGKAGALDSKADMIPANIKNAYPGFVYAGSVEYSDSNLVSLFNQGYACVVKVQNGENEHFVAVKTATDVDNIEIMDPGPDNTSLSHYGGGLEIFYFRLLRIRYQDIQFLPWIHREV